MPPPLYTINRIQLCGKHWIHTESVQLVKQEGGLYYEAVTGNAMSVAVVSTDYDHSSKSITVDE